MANLRDAKPTSNAGITTITLSAINLQKENEYGPQLEFNFTSDIIIKDFEGNEKPLTYKYWHRLTGILTEKYNLTVFLKNLHQWVDVRAAVHGQEEAQEKFDSLVQAARDFDDQDLDDIQNFEVAFIKAMIGDAVGQKMKAVLAYKGKYLNMPSGKLNNYKLPFGNAPYMSPNLPMHPQEAVVEFNGVETAPEETSW